MMGAGKQWSVDLHLDEQAEQRRTVAEARLRAADQPELVGVGVAQRNPDDQEVPVIGDELAAARALSDLARQLTETAAGDIEQITHQPVRLSG